MISVVSKLLGASILALISTTSVLVSSFFVGPLPPVIQNCPSDFTVTIQDPGSCDTTLFWVPPTVTDDCDATDFTGPFVSGNWTETTFFNGNVDVSGAPTSVILSGGTDGSQPNTTTLGATLCITIPADGTLAFDWDAYMINNGGSTTGGSFNNDFPAYSINGTPTYLANSGNTANGTVSLNLVAGDQFCFEVYTMNRAYYTVMTIDNFSFDNSTIAQTSGPTPDAVAGDNTGTTVGIGEHTIEYTATDGLGNTSTCSFVVTVNELVPPTIDCGADITVQIDNSTDCEAYAYWATPTAADNCDADVTVTQISGPLSESADGAEDGDLLAVGVYTITYEAVDDSGNTAQCSFKLTVLPFEPDGLACDGQNISLDEDCITVVTADMLYAGTEMGCPSNYIVTFYNANGTAIGNTLNTTHVGKTLNYTICLKLIDFCCSGKALIEDKIKPTLVCKNDTISCVSTLETADVPTIVDNCRNAVRIKLDEKTEPLSCDPLFTSRVLRTWTVNDAYGNYGDTCKDTIFIQRTNITGIIRPANLIGANALSCNSFVPDANGFPPPSLTGVPTLNGVSLYPFNQAVICNGYVRYEDQVTFNTSCKKMILRTWEIGEWWCNSTNAVSWGQIIEISDRTAPVIGAVQNITVSTSGHSCTANVAIPPVSVTDNCSAFSVSIHSDSGFANTNGGNLVLQSGNHTVTYRAEDACGNQSEKSIQVLVVDNASPVALCATTTVVSLKADGTAWLNASSVNDGSFDECSAVTIELRRMNSDPCGHGTDTIWTDKVPFCCADLNTNPMVAMRVTDAGGNTNICMVAVQVQDKFTPSMVCPLDVTVNCDTAYDLNNLGATFGNPTLIGGGCTSASNITETHSDDINQCRIGTITRVFTLTKNGVTLQTCTQKVHLQGITPFTASNIVWPKDTTLVNAGCSLFDLSPDKLPAGYNKPILTEGTCSLVASSKEDDEFPFTTNGACFKIVRNWTVIDWCQRNPDGTIPRWTHQQVLVIMNTTDPIITSNTTTRTVCSQAADCSPVPIQLIATATDDCTLAGELNWKHTITLEDGTKINGTGNNASGTYPLGHHSVHYVVTDKCGNSASTGFNFDVLNCKLPTPYCKSGLSTSLIAMDLQGNDGIPDAEMVILKPSFFDNGSYHSCGYKVKLSFSANVNDTIKTYSCSDIKRNFVNLWVTDENGNQDYCTTYVDVADNNNVSICPAVTPGVFGVTGNISTIENKQVEKTQVTLQNTEAQVSTTDVNGMYGFENQAEGETFDVTPNKNDDTSKGITTLDLLLIQRHILGSAKLQNPYKIIAGDINKDNKISSVDIVELRKVILGLTNHFANNESWRFIDKAFVFPDNTNPWVTPFPESYHIDALNTMMKIDFYGVKVGDLNGSALNNVVNESTDNRAAVNISAIDKSVNEGEIIEIPLTLDQVKDMYGLQFALKCIDGVIADVKSDFLDESQLAIENNILKVSYVDAEGMNLGGQPLLTLVVKADKNTTIDKMLSLEATQLNAEVYTGNKEVVASPLNLDLRQKDVSLFTVLQNQPNPWNVFTTIKINIPEAGEVGVRILDLSGKVLYTTGAKYEAGKHLITIEKSQISTTGVLLYEVSYQDKKEVKKMIVLE